MFRHHHNLKRALGLLGVVLALASSAQQSRLVCSLAGCAPSHFCGEHSDCDHARSVNPTGPTSCEPACGGEGVNEPCPTESPCPVNCWCHQAPEPYGLPRVATEVLEPLEYSAATSSVGTLSEVAAKQVVAGKPAAVMDATVDSAVERCAVLCRFLI